MLLYSQDLKTLGKDVESDLQIHNTLQSEQEYIPAVDYSTASNFAFFGSARKYYDDSIKRIYRTFPYDGSIAEFEKWWTESTHLDKYMFNFLYPKSTGYARLGYNWGEIVHTANAYSAPASSSYEYIQFKGGPHLGFDLEGDRYTRRLGNYFANSNIYDETKKRTSNLEIDHANAYSGSDAGVTIEFWLKKNGFDVLNVKEILFDLWNGKASTEHDYGRITIETNVTASDTCLRVTCLSGTSGFSYHEIGNSLTNVANLGDNNWQHLAFSFFNADDVPKCRLYIDGETIQTIENLASSELGKVSGSLIANIGSLRTNVKGMVGNAEGHGKLLSASLDEFRYWKVRRTDKEIKTYYNRRVGGGTNTDENTTKLGVYYKFNEGITQTASVDNLVLDYSGRVSNGTWQGYSHALLHSTLSPRHTGSAMVEASASNREFEDPIVYSFHPDVVSLRSNLNDSGTIHDLNNHSSLWKQLPSWITNEDTSEQSEEDGQLSNLIQILASPLDNLYIKTKYLPKFGSVMYDRDKLGQDTAARQLLSSLGLGVPSIMNDASVFEYFMKAKDDKNYDISVAEIKNKIYRNIYNNLVHINKAKGTEAAYRNLIRCFGVDNNLIKLNIYADNKQYEIQNNVENKTISKNLLNFYNGDHFGATIYQNSGNIDGVLSPPYIPAPIVISNNDFIPFSLEGEFVFPRVGEHVPTIVYADFLSSSLFGVHNAIDDSFIDLTWATPETASLQLYAIKSRTHAKDAKFLLTGTVGGLFPVLTSSFIPNVYNDEKWNFSVGVKHSKHPFSNLVSGSNYSNEGDYVLEFYGVSTISDVIQKSKEIYLTASLNNEQGKNFLRSNKRVYAGSHRTNHTGNILQYTDVMCSYVRAWYDFLPTSSLLAHAKYGGNSETIGRDKFFHSFSPFVNLNNSEIPKIDTLLLNWQFSANTASDANGIIDIMDESSGSFTSATSRYGWYGETVRNNYPAQGRFFKNSSTASFVRKDIPVVSLKLPEMVDSYSSIQIDVNDSDIYTKNSRPEQTIVSFEKNMYQNMSEDMLSWFASLVDFSDIIGHPSEKYRTNYKKLDNLRHLYFEKIENEPDFEKFYNFYKWLDNSMLKILQQFVPVSSKMTNAWNVVESHLFERNKFVHKFPLLETKTSTTASIGSVGQFSFVWEEGKSPLNLNQEESGQWWQEKSTLDNNIWNFLPSDVRTNRRNIGLIKQEALNRKYKSPLLLHDSQVITVEKLGNDDSNAVFRRKLLERSGQGSAIIISSSLINAPKSEYNTNLKDANEHYVNKRRKFYNFGVNLTDSPDKYSNKIFVPFNFVSSSVKTGYNSSISSAFSQNVQLVDLHPDSYGEEMGMQGTFVQSHVGGFLHRHSLLNTGSHTSLNRPELFKVRTNGTNIEIVSNDDGGTATPPSLWSREGYVKKFYNTANISSSNPNLLLGNYTENYQVINTTGRLENNKFLKSNDGIIVTAVSSTYLPEIVEFSVPRRDLTGSRSILAVRFAAPGSAEAGTVGSRNIESNEYSPYNTHTWRNYIPKETLTQLWATASNKFGVVDSLVPVSASFHKTPRNQEYRLEASGESVVTGVNYDNHFITKPLPRSDLQYSWIKRTSIRAGGIPRTNRDSVIPFGYSQKDNHDGIHRDIVYISASEYGSYYTASDSTRYWGSHVGEGKSQFLYVDFVGMNTNLYEPVSSSNNLLGYPQLVAADMVVGNGKRINYINQSYVVGVDGENTDTSLDPNQAIATTLNAINLKRNGPYGYPPWKQTRTGGHPVIREQNKGSVLSVVSQIEEQFDSNNSSFMPRKYYKFKQYVEPNVSMRSRPLSTIIKQDGQLLKIDNSFGLLDEKFGNQGLNSDAFLYQYEKKHDIHNNIKNIYGVKNNNGVDLYSINYREVVYPNVRNIGLSRTRSRLFLTESSGYGNNGYDRNASERQTFWPPTFTRTSVSGSTPFRNALNLQWGRSAYPFGNSAYWFEGDSASVGDSLRNPAYLTIYSKSVNYYEGELSPQMATSNTGSGLVGFTDVIHQSLFGHGQSWPSGTAMVPANMLDGRPMYISPTASLQYVYMASIGKYTEFSWPYEIHQQAGRGAFFNSYNDFSHDIHYMSNGHTILPEFRISDYMDYFYENNNSLKTEITDFLKLDGAYLSKSADSYTSSLIEDFFNTYTDSSFMTNFKEALKDGHDNGKSVKSVTMKCHGIKKLLPYNGFYPVNRTVQLGSYFAQALTGNLENPTGYPDPDLVPVASQQVQTLLQPFFSPGIVYNTIKSGLAVDWPVLTSSVAGATALYPTIKPGWAAAPYDPFVIYLSSSGVEQTEGRDDWQCYVLSSSHNISSANRYGQFHHRIPFETLVDFSKGLLSGTEIHYLGPDKILQATASNRTVYPRFKWNGKQQSNKFSYAMHNFLAEIPNFFLYGNQLNRLESEPEKNFKPLKKNITYYMDVSLYKTDDLYMMKSYFNNAQISSSIPLDKLVSYNGKYFGPPVLAGNVPTTAEIGDGLDTRAFMYADPAYAPFTPPYFYGKAKARLSIRASESRKYSLDEIMANAIASASYINFADIDVGTPLVGTEKWIAQANAMRVKSSVNLFNKSNTLESVDSTGLDKWEISTKFECPVLNFNNPSHSLEIAEIPAIAANQ